MCYKLAAGNVFYIRNITSNYADHANHADYIKINYILPKMQVLMFVLNMLYIVSLATTSVCKHLQYQDQYS